ncbi:MAG TPA: hypothetical protein VF175_01900 [Lacipirellula sp.]
MLALPCLAYTQSYYGAGYQPAKVKPFASQSGAGQGHANYMHPTRDLYNQYFYHRPSVSPYLNLGRPTAGGTTTAYHAWVRPEQQRRERQAQQQSAYIAARKQQTRYTGASYGAGSKVGMGAAPMVKPSAYYNQWYGGKHYR